MLGNRDGTLSGDSTLGSGVRTLGSRDNILGRGVSTLGRGDSMLGNGGQYVLRQQSSGSVTYLPKIYCILNVYYPIQAADECSECHLPNLGHLPHPGIWLLCFPTHSSMGCPVMMSPTTVSLHWAGEHQTFLFINCLVFTRLLVTRHET